MTERTPADVTAAIAPCTARAMVAAGIEPGPIKRRKPSCVAIGARGLLSCLHFWIDSVIIGKNRRGQYVGASIGKTRVYLKTHDVTGSEGFLRCARHFFAGILTYFKEK